MLWPLKSIYQGAGSVTLVMLVSPVFGVCVVGPKQMTQLHSRMNLPSTHVQWSRFCRLVLFLLRSVFEEPVTTQTPFMKLFTITASVEQDG
jgi:hypothetical protein